MTHRYAGIPIDPNVNDVAVAFCPTPLGDDFGSDFDPFYGRRDASMSIRGADDTTALSAAWEGPQRPTLDGYRTLFLRSRDTDFVTYFRTEGRRFRDEWLWWQGQ